MHVEASNSPPQARVLFRFLKAHMLHVKVKLPTGPQSPGSFSLQPQAHLAGPDPRDRGLSLGLDPRGRGSIPVYSTGPFRITSITAQLGSRIVESFAVEPHTLYADQEAIELVAESR